MTDQQRVQSLAEELASQLPPSQGQKVLNLVRTPSTCGTNTSEFALAAIAITAGLGLVVLGTFRPEQTGLVDEGLELVKWAVVGYGVSRGIAKAGTVAKKV